MQQLSLLDLIEPPAPPPKRWCDLPRRTITIRAYGGERDVTLTDDEPDPFEITVRGIACTISYSVGFCTYVIDGPGSPFWSETGFRSFGYHTADRDTIRAMIEKYIDGPTKHGNGCGGQLTRWWPFYVREWQDRLSRSLTCDRATMWDQWGPARHAEIWAQHDAKIAEAQARMWAEGIDPNDVGRPKHHKGQWPQIERPAQ